MSVLALVFQNVVVTVVIFTAAMQRFVSFYVLCFFRKIVISNVSVRDDEGNIKRMKMEKMMSDPAAENTKLSFHACLNFEYATQ